MIEQKIFQNDFKSIGQKVFKLRIDKNGIEEEYICNLFKLKKIYSELFLFLLFFVYKKAKICV